MGEERRLLSLWNVQDMLFEIAVSKRSLSTCPKARLGAVLVNEGADILGTGFNLCAPEDK